MNKEEFRESFEKSKIYFNEGSTLDYKFRMNALISLEESIRNHEKEIFEALQKDLGKTPYEAFMTEIALVYSELKNARKKLKKWMKPKKGKLSLSQLPGKGYIYQVPYGVVLIMSPWNYPFQLTIVPMIGAISSGNCIFVKPSAYSKYTSDIIGKIIKESFDDKYIKFVSGGREENQALLDLPFDYIFFTGSKTVGKYVMQQASNNLTPLTLELGGKSPCIINKDADIQKTAKRILFGKLLNSGQTCVAPDYVLIEETICKDFIKTLKNEYIKMFENEDYFIKHAPKIINERHYNRIIGLTEGEKLWSAFDIKKYKNILKIPFIIIENGENSKAMNEEIFGPILPIITWKRHDEMMDFLRTKDKPLALYCFSKDKKFINNIIRNVDFGGGAVNDTILHMVSAGMPFGGVGASGMGKYHGYYSFDTFSHEKSILKKSLYFDNTLRYHPFKDKNKKLPEKFF